MASFLFSIDLYDILIKKMVSSVKYDKESINLL